MEELDISNVRELEDLLITDCFYGQLLKGKLDQSQRFLHVSLLSSEVLRCLSNSTPYQDVFFFLSETFFAFRFMTLSPEM